MNHKFMKLAGIKSMDAFYKAFPTEEAFFKAFPDAAPKLAKGGKDNSAFKVKPNFAKGGTIDTHTHSIPKDAMVHDKKLTKKQKKFFSDMCDAANMKKAAWGASLGTDQFVGGPGPVNPYPQGFKIPKLDANGNPIPETDSSGPVGYQPGTYPNQVYKGAISGEGLPTNPVWNNSPSSLMSPAPQPPTNPNRPKTYDNRDYIPNKGEGNLNRGQLPNLTTGQQQWDQTAIQPKAPVNKGPELKAPQSQGLEGSGGQLLQTGLMMAAALMPKEKIRRRYVRPEDMESYNPGQYGHGSQALSEYGNTLKGKKKNAFWGAVIGAVAGEAKNKSKKDLTNLVNNAQEAAAPLLMVSNQAQAEADRLNNLYKSGGVQNMANLQNPMAQLPNQYPQPYNPNAQYMEHGGEMKYNNGGEVQVQNYYEEGKEYDVDERELQRLLKAGYALKY